MVRYYVKKTDRKATSPRKLSAAVNLVRGGQSLRSVARLKNINRQTLWKACQKTKNLDAVSECTQEVQLKYGKRHIFSKDIEDSIVSYCLEVAQMGYGLSTDNVRELAFEVADKNKIQMPEKWSVEKKAGLDWFQGFMTRHKELSIRKPEGCSIARAAAFNKDTVEKFYFKYEAVLGRHPTFANGSRVYNLDETSTSTVQNARKIVSPKGQKQVHQVKSQERGVSVTTCCIIGAHGSVLPPVMIFPRKFFKSNMLINAFPGTLGLANLNGYMTTATFLDVINHFVKCTRSSKENPTLLLVDNVGTHLSGAAIDLCRENGVTLFTFPPHTTHRLQPLDVGIFGPFKTYYDAAINSFLVSNPAVPVTIYHIAGFVKEAFSKSATPANIIASFQKPGIFPLNKFVFQDSDFLMSKVTELQNPNTANPTSANLNSDDEATENLITNYEASEEAEDDPNENNEDYVDVSNEAGEPSTSSAFLTPEKIRGYPKAKPQVSTRKGRPKDSPERNEIKERERLTLEKKNAQEERKAKAEEKRRQKESETTSKKRKLKDKQELEGKKIRRVRKSKDKLELEGKKKTRVQRVLSFEDDLLIDNPEEDDVIMKENSPKVDERTINEGDYVLVKFKKYFVGKVIKEGGCDGDFEISYLSKSVKPKKRIAFVMPNVPDIRTVKKSNIEVVLPKPIIPKYVTKRLEASLSFNFNFSIYELE
ncbi:uncharacterized protein LOC117641222 [Thrips palmi]|uniref:Uncharacterized protein LOC117641222 n=1 Tax=Thrips palmi TaxID=161013 RepID=A0A6P8YBT2_THRPL|nr:uncharacterized protein LOC117641222 [Thrips palmi]